ncbi:MULTISPECIES: 6-pyruvoyl trahydropterin synthase family protein [Methylocaldum]|jgi:6-pyruvoyltetrahydropterin/6-carboxytetrahydropterin synthase|uniref:6-pyruvoyl trahydropterin synthase family protein n=1 Tax=unclassified Methylocaldum TaxID=2622260 RepID=UPI000989C65B|nr:MULTISPECIES: 6-carboxytetrahydropterin synthase [unclassified Methylocaldum]MBP1151403.1 6-pyruvoyltetrahydropterin/6-carboxytetrahydropterin synthase [Methylocaldum sp. RMAD-M]
MYQLAITRDFIARHFLIGGDWGAENHEHSHHYKAEVLIEGEQLDRHGYLIDIVDLEQATMALIGEFKDRVLNDLEPFRGLNPSLERFARIFWERLRDRVTLHGVKMTIKLWENDRDWAAFGGTL